MSQTKIENSIKCMKILAFCRTSLKIGRDFEHMTFFGICSKWLLFLIYSNYFPFLPFLTYLPSLPLLIPYFSYSILQHGEMYQTNTKQVQTCLKQCCQFFSILSYPSSYSIFQYFLFSISFSILFFRSETCFNLS